MRMRTPQRMMGGYHSSIQLPLEAFYPGFAQESADLSSPTSLVTFSPPPALPPSVPLSLWEALPAAPPSLPPMFEPSQVPSGFPSTSLEASPFEVGQKCRPPPPSPMSPGQSPTQSPMGSPFGGSCHGVLQALRFSPPPSPTFPPPSSPPLLASPPRGMPPPSFAGLLPRTPPPPGVPAAFFEASTAASFLEALARQSCAAGPELPPPRLPPSLPLELRARVASGEDSDPALFSLFGRTVSEGAVPPGTPQTRWENEEGAATPVVTHGRGRFPPGLPPPTGSPSHGSTLHITGQCRPCAWFWKPSGCHNGSECGRCHLCPSGEMKVRKRVKQTVMQLGLATPLNYPLGDYLSTPPGFCMDQLDATDFPAVPPLPPFFAPCLDFGLNLDFGLAVGPARQNRLGSFSSDQASTTTGAVSEQDGSGSELGEASHALAAAPGEAKPKQGTSMHGHGICKPCAWFWKPVGCQADSNCKYCHLCPEGELKNRKKDKVMLMRMGAATPTTTGEDGRQTLSLSLAPLV